ncbi:hypothetical protein [Pseudogemmobacter sonorensis]|uniref:hypothetical protein n=1 Tax=Pseudogemmobacter sonorensis TaxID=2989681 RepID=UPI0036A466A4
MPDETLLQDRETSRLLADLRDLAHVRLDLQKRLDLALAERAALAAEIDALRRSQSWRITAPLRWVSGALHRLRAGLGR